MISAVNGPVISVRGGGFAMAETVYINDLPGEVIALKPNRATIQLYENPTGLRPGMPVEKTGRPMSITMRPGIIGGIFDGIMRDLVRQAHNEHRGQESSATNALEAGSSFAAEAMRHAAENALEAESDVAAEAVRQAHNENREQESPATNAPEAERKFATKIFARVGDILNEGDIFAEVRETKLFTYRATVPPGISGAVIRAAEDGEFSATDEICALELPCGRTEILTLSQTWPIRTPRPVRERLTGAVPLITGQRVVDSLFPLAKGGTCAIPGGFGTGKTSLQHQIAKYCDADVIIYIGCGERGNEMTDVLHSFAELKDPKTGAPLTERTVLIANTSDMPVAAREACIYTGITLAEFFRDMGLHVAIMADSTSRWAEALRELSSRLEEIPAEEGYPSYLAARLAAFYSRAGYVRTLGKVASGTNESGTDRLGANPPAEYRVGSITIIGAVSPQGGDFSEPVTLHTKRFTRCFWALDARLAHARHFPAIDPLQSYSDYAARLDDWFSQNIHADFPAVRTKVLEILRREQAILEVVNLAGYDALSDDEQKILHTARELRENFTAQNARVEPFCPLDAQFKMMNKILGGISC